MSKVSTISQGRHNPRFLKYYSKISQNGLNAAYYNEILPVQMDSLKNYHWSGVIELVHT